VCLCAHGGVQIYARARVRARTHARTFELLAILEEDARGKCVHLYKQNGGERE
jgi:hypothetical protein